jgi:poly(3-hydroxybutyrate) depolymerase
LVAASCGPASAPTVTPPVVVEPPVPAAAGRGSAGCGKVPGDVMDGRLVVDALERTFVIDVPRPYDPRRPLPIAYGFHGNWDSGAGARKGYRLAQAWGEPMIAIYPDGLREAPDKPTTWAFDAGSRDFAFFDALHEAVLSQLCVDLDRVFVFGYSSGGFMANAIACTHGEMVRGVGAISAGGRHLGGTRCGVVRRAGAGIPRPWRGRSDRTARSRPASARDVAEDEPMHPADRARCRWLRAIFVRAARRVVHASGATQTAPEHPRRCGGVLPQSRRLI